VGWWVLCEACIRGEVKGKGVGPKRANFLHDKHRGEWNKNIYRQRKGQKREVGQRSNKNCGGKEREGKKNYGGQKLLLAGSK